MGMPSRTVLASVILLCVFLLAGCQSSPASREPVPPMPSAPEAGTPIARYPDLTGTWTAVIRAIYTGEGPLPLGVASQDPTVDFLRLEIVIDVQQDQMFYGTIKSAEQEERFAGAIRENGREAIYITRSGRGHLWFDPEHPDVIEVCGGRGNPDTLMAVCGRIERLPPE